MLLCTENDLLQKKQTSTFFKQGQVKESHIIVITDYTMGVAMAKYANIPEGKKKFLTQAIIIREVNHLYCFKLL